MKQSAGERHIPLPRLSFRPVFPKCILPAEKHTHNGTPPPTYPTGRLRAGRNPESVFPNLTRLISDNIQIEIEEEEEPEEETQSKVEEAPDRFAEYLEDLQYAKSFKEQFGTDSTEMNEETASTKFYFGVLRDFFGL